VAGVLDETDSLRSRIERKAEKTAAEGIAR